MAASAEPATILCDSCDGKFTSSQQYEKHQAEVHEKQPKSVPLKGATDDKPSTGPQSKSCVRAGDYTLLGLRLTMAFSFSSAASEVPTPTRFLAALPKVSPAIVLSVMVVGAQILLFLQDLFPTGVPVTADASGAAANPFDQSFAEAQRAGTTWGISVSSLCLLCYTIHAAFVPVRLSASCSRSCTLYLACARAC